MATANPFDILGDDDNDDPSQLIVKHEKKIQSKKAAPAPAAPATSKFPSKPAPPTQAARETRSNNTVRGGFGHGGTGRGAGGGRGGSGRTREFRSDNTNGLTDRTPTIGGEEGRDGNKSSEAPHHSYRGPRRGGYQEEEYGRPPRRTYERRSGTGRGNEMPRQGSGRGNWGSFSDEPVSQEHEEKVNDEQKAFSTEKPTDETPHAEPKDSKDEAGEKEEEEDKEMTLEEYEKIREESRKALLALKTTEERKVEIDKDLQLMQVLSTKKSTEEVFIKLGSAKDTQKKRDAERDERAKKSLSINEFLKPAEGEKYYGGGGSRGRGNRGRGQFRGGYGGSRVQPPAIEDQLQFPSLGGK
ncbi:hypothetical protein LUZ63_013621 [Rhynchospora breviuscula]|uniref:Hyaluronan/mRNA-binding protein domain-containing protein n=1 Tax=Rhynchospora breviuscula TaxID=2022672 RepID=A0A9Q0C8W0_9POAL|nr:hypothetical protein LUZ63_013621 [Rhynchospora breviuscula]